MNIAFFSDTFLPQINGVVTYLIETGRELKKLGHNVLFVVPKSGDLILPEGFSPKELYLEPSVSADQIYPQLRVASVYSYGLDRCLSKFKPDVIHAHAPFAIGFGAILAARRFGKPLVATYHTFISSEEIFKLAGVTKGRGTRVLKRLTWEYSKLFYNPCDLVLAPTAGIAEILRKNGIKAPTEVLHEGIRLSEFRLLTETERSALRSRYKLGQGQAILFVGRLSKEKGLPLLLQVMALVVERLPKAKLLLVGDGPQKEELKRLAKRLGIEENVFFTGFMAREKILSEGLYSACDLFLTVSKFETFGLTVLEAMGSGLPIVTVESQGASELVEGNGFVCSDDKIDIAENVIKILTDVEMARRFGQISLRIRENYAVEKTTAELVRHYQRLLDRPLVKPRLRWPASFSDLTSDLVKLIKI